MLKYDNRSELVQISRSIVVSFVLILVSVTTLYSQGFRYYRPLAVPVRDGKSLAADLYATDTLGAKPVILIQTPYNKNLYRLRMSLPPQTGSKPFPVDSMNYHYVTLDWRGFWESKSAAVVGYDRGLDGYDVVEWLAAQSWCNGKIGTWGPSALGAIQFMTAKHDPPHLVCSVPLVKDFKTKYTDYFYGGVFRKEHVETLTKLGFVTTNLITSNPVYNNLGRAVEAAADYPDKIGVPMLLVGGWFDHYPDDVLRAFEDLRLRSDKSVRDKHKIIFGPWLHSHVDSEEQGELTYPGASGVTDFQTQRFFDYHILGAKNGYPLEATVKYYLMGSNEWREASSWTGIHRSDIKLYLSNGGLSKSAPQEPMSFSEIVYDPRDPSPAYGAARFNPFDPSVKSGPLDISGVIENRNDALVYTTPPVTDSLHILGTVTANLFLSSDRTDTDVSVRLCDVFPDGRSMIMTDGIKRLRFRDGVDREVLLTPGQIYPVSVELQNLALQIDKGHSLRIVISSSDYPRFDINLNNGGPLYTAGDTLTAVNRIYHDASHPSSITIQSAAVTAALRDPHPGSSNMTLGPGYPNPWNSSNTVSFFIPSRMHVRLTVYNSIGVPVRSLADEAVEAGTWTRTWYGDDTAGNPAPPGVYFYVLSGKNRNIVRPISKTR